MTFWSLLSIRSLVRMYQKTSWTSIIQSSLRRIRRCWTLVILRLSLDTIQDLRRQRGNLTNRDLNLYFSTTFNWEMGVSWNWMSTITMKMLIANDLKKRWKRDFFKKELIKWIRTNSMSFWTGFKGMILIQ